MISTVYVLIVISSSHSGGIGFDHTFNTEKACQVAADNINNDGYSSKAFCIPDQVEQGE